MINILIANGVNLDLLGKRPSEIYGEGSLIDLKTYLSQQKAYVETAVGTKISLTFFQSNDEAQFLGKFDEGWDGAVINPGAWTHTSLALADRLEALRLPFVEVHLSKLARRESFRQTSYTATHALGVIEGFAFHSYVLGLWGLASHIKSS